MSNGTGNAKKSKLVKLGALVVFLLAFIVIMALALASVQKKSADVAILNELSQARKQAELYVDANNRSYLNVCAGADVGGVPTLYSMLDTVARKYGYTLNLNERAGGQGLVSCNDTVNEWAAEAPLTKENTFFCVDFRGRATTTIGSTLDAYDTRCE